MSRQSHTAHARRRRHERRRRQLLVVGMSAVLAGPCVLRMRMMRGMGPDPVPPVIRVGDAARAGDVFGGGDHVTWTVDIVAPGAEAALVRSRLTGPSWLTSSVPLVCAAAAAPGVCQAEMVLPARLAPGAYTVEQDVITADGHVIGTLPAARITIGGPPAGRRRG